MATTTIYTIVYPSDPDSISMGDNSSFVVVSSNPPPEDTIATAVYTQTVTTDDTTVNQPSADGLDFTADGDDWKAPLPSVPSLQEINIPVGPVASPDNVSITYQFEPLKINQEIEQSYIYLISGSSLLKIDQDGNMVETITTKETVDEIEAGPTGTVLWLGASKVAAGEIIQDLYGLSPIDGEPIKYDTTGEVLAFSFGIMLDKKGLSNEDINNFYVRVKPLMGSSRKIRLTDDPSFGSFSFSLDGTMYVHGTSLDPTATTGHDFAVISAYMYNLKQKVWRYTFTDWIYGDISREKIVASTFDNDGNCYCVTDAWEQD